MFGYNKITENEIKNKNAMQLFTIQQACTLIKNGVKFDIAIDIAKSNTLILMNKNEELDLTDYDLVDDACRFATFGGDDFDIMMMDVIDKLNNNAAKQALAQQIIYNAVKTQKYIKSNFGLDTKLKYTINILNDIKDGKDDFSPAKILISTYPNIHEGDDISIKEISNHLLSSENFNHNEVKHKLKDINKVIDKFPFIESTQRMRYLKQALLFTIETNSIDLLNQYKNPLTMDVRNIHNDFLKAVKTKNIVSNYKQKAKKEIDLGLDFDYEEVKESKNQIEKPLNVRVVDISKKRNNKKRNVYKKSR